VVTIEIYRGYDIERTDHGYVVSKDGVPVTRCVSQEQAYAWVDQERRKAR
jgi:hypothetical protein